MNNNTCITCNSNNLKEIEAKEMLLWTRKIFKYNLCLDCWCSFLKDKIDDFSIYYPKEYHCFVNETLPLRKKFALFKVQKFNFYKKWFLWKLIWNIFEMIHWHFPETYIWWLGDAFRELGWKNKNLRILDIWCWSWAILKQLKGFWFKNLFWVEPFADNSKSEINIIKEPIENFLNKNHEEKFDIVLLSHVLEHLYNHENIISWLKNLVSNNWLIIIAMPILWKSFDKFWTNLYSFDAPRHVLLHSNKSFEYLLNKLWLSIVKEIYEEVPWNLWASELYSWNISNNEFKWKKIEKFSKNNYKYLSNLTNQLKSWWSSVAYILRKNKND